MKSFFASLLIIILLSGYIYANDIFTDRELKDLRVIEVNAREGNVWIQDAEGNEAGIIIGDTIGVERGIVIEIKEASIIIQRDNTLTKMPVVYGFE